MPAPEISNLSPYSPGVRDRRREFKPLIQMPSISSDK